MVSRLILIILVTVATCFATRCPLPTSACSQPPVIVHMTCGNSLPQSLPPPPPLPPRCPSPKPVPTTQAPPEATTETIEATTEDPTGLISTKPQTCYQDNDLVIVLDSSGSIGEDDYKIALEFSARLANAWKKHPGNGIAIYIYGMDVEKVFDLNEGRQMSQADLQHTILNARYMQSLTYTNKGLEAAVQEFYLRGRKVPRNVVLLTDGASSNPPQTLAAARLLHQAGVRAVSVGIGRYLNPQELLEIAGNEPRHVFSSNEFDDLLTLLKPVSVVLCDDSRAPTVLRVPAGGGVLDLGV